MDQLKVGWIGFGNMAKAMAQGLIGSGRIAPDALYACARDQRSCRTTQRRSACMRVRMRARSLKRSIW
ncbi:MAG: NAD(P)-binding domain-containing protein [Merdibacter sp.]